MYIAVVKKSACKKISQQQKKVLQRIAKAAMFEE